MDERVRPYAAGQTIDYLETPRGQGFVIAPTGGRSGC
jgi:Fe-S cluster assembly iron-binding protein IscA